MDDYRHQGLRKRLVEVLKSKGISDAEVLAAVNSIPRHFFIDDTAFMELAYQDVAFPIACGQTISQPYTVAFQTELLQLKKGMKVLEVGTGSGYQTAVLVHLGAKVFSIERHRPLYMLTKDRLMGMNLRANLYHGDGYKGLEREAPFDRILVTCGAPYIPLDLQHQLKVGGRLVIPVGEGEEQRMLCVERLSDVDFATKDLGSFRFVPMLQDKA
ncbi:MAG: protein-L-isoaspartate(D-aspartate) O-methyltransferase [Flavobacteriales bacterium]|nr:protein-L-isoaspartate(D-aspartate) O-methyltransferase [Flavobacteriales bacterium]MBP6643836.1 protein-L-isoaspartate(D-aspartate) O-methyltransferase [Flavobacteriales bacterium]MBP7157077.1 protein-L-isoaspartate(D-aspartate) O-methyltransferase [Flavobacteriales bacterium]HQV74980.1 protein-L-isoaspartate(D-aspartate) O-methyltransferase [Flavobacteriales bacterium]HQW41508.1 protein-L-isoaspartate(D-aspartate) O-methyltransferase [Flavobacteriales bacterium]